MRLDHIAFRVNSKDGAKNLLSKLLGYTIKQPFEIFFEDGTAVECFALKPPEDISKKLKHKLSKDGTIFEIQNKNTNQLRT